MRSFEDERELRVRQLAVRNVEVRAADGAGVDTDQCLSLGHGRFGHLTLAERLSGPFEHHRAHRSGSLAPTIAA